MNQRTSRTTVHLWKDPWLAAMILVHATLFVLYILYSLPGSPLSAVTLVYEDKGLLPMLALAIAAPWAGLPPIQNQRERLFWRCWSFALGAVLLVRILYLVDPELEQHNTGALTQDVLYLVFYLLMILSLQLKPHRPEGGGKEEWPVHPLELVGTGVFVLALLVYFIGVPHFLAPWDYDTWIPSLVLYWTLDCFIFAHLLYLRQTASSREWRILYSWLGLAVACWILTDFAEILYYSDILPLETYGLLDYLWYAPWLLIGVAGRVRVDPVPQLLGAGGAAREPTPGEGQSRAGWLIIAALALPAIHVAADMAGFLDPDTNFIRDLVVLLSLLALLALAYVHQRSLVNRATILAWEKEEAEERRELLAAAVEQAPDIILIASAEARIWYANAALSSAGQIPADVLGYPLDQILAHAEPGPGRVSLPEALRTGTGWEGRGKITKPGGSAREELVTVSPVRNDKGEVSNFVAIRRDVTHRTRLERQARQTQRMKSLARLSAGMAHHFNRSLRSVRGHAEILAGSFADDAPEREEIRGILESVKTASDMVDRILIFSQSMEEKKTRVDVPKAVHETISLLRPGLSAGSNIIEQVQPDAGAIWVDPQQLHEAMANLCGHRLREIAESGGELQVWVDRVSIGRRRAGALALAGPGEYVHVAVRDSAPGLSAEDLDQIFDPFYPGSDAADGGDLSLPVVHGAVESAGGAITVESQGETGNLFQLYFPLADGPEE